MKPSNALAARRRREHWIYHPATSDPTLHHRLRAQQALHSLSCSWRGVAEDGEPLPAQGLGHVSKSLTTLLALCFALSYQLFSRSGPLR